MARTKDVLHACTLAELVEKGSLVVAGPVPIALFYEGGKLYAVDNRCPHMGFPLHRGTLHDGILTCHWHHARFDASSGCTFDLFADDVVSYPVEVRDGEVCIQIGGPAADPIADGQQRLIEGMEQNIRLVIAKAVVGLVNAGHDTDEIARLGGLFGVAHRQRGWSSGLTILTAMANVADHLETDERIAPFYQGLLHVADDCAGHAPKFALQPLRGGDVEIANLHKWFRDMVEVRSIDGAERCLLTAVANGASIGELAELMLAAATDHYYLDGGHTVDFINKAFELLDRIGWGNADKILPSLVSQLCQAQRSEEENAWRNPIDLIALVEASYMELPELLAEGRARRWQRPDAMIDILLGDDPEQIIGEFKEALRQGAEAVELAQTLVYVAALRVVRFHVQNEIADWIAVLHTFTYCNGLHQLLKRAQSPDLLRGVFHGAIRVYLDRFLNIPPARLPAAKGPVVATGDTLQDRFLELLDRQMQVDEAGEMVYRYLAAGGQAQRLLRILAESLLREDAEFHSFQVLEAAIRQYGELENDEERRIMLVAAARYLAAHAPTQRELQQTLRIALRLHRGEPVYEAE